MAQVELIMPKMGESIMEATVLKWVKKVGDTVEVDETILEIATDKVDSEVPSPVAGTIVKILAEENENVAIGKVIAIIATEGTETDTPPPSQSVEKEATTSAPKNEIPAPLEVAQSAEIAKVAAVLESNIGDAITVPRVDTNGRFYSPLVKNIAKKEGIPFAELSQVTGTGKDGRVTKTDILTYVANRPYLRNGATQTTTKESVAVTPMSSPTAKTLSKPVSGNVEIIEMDRMRRLIADHMVMSKRTSPHVTSFVEVDVTEIVNWRNRVKKQFQEKYSEKITFTPIFMEAVVKAIVDFPRINVSVDGNNIILKKDINIGMATALPSGNLIVPVIKQADDKSLLGLTRSVNDLAARARQNKLKPDETQGGTFTLTNVGTFGNVMGTPIINQPQAAIMAVGAIRKKPAVVETEYGDLIAVRQMMFISMSYDHRVVDGFLGGSFLRKVGDYLEAFDKNRVI